MEFPEMTSTTTTTTPLAPAVGFTDPGLMSDADGERPDPQVPERARRRRFTAKYKLVMVAAYDAAPDGHKGALLRREGLYSSHIVEWRKARDAGGLQALGVPRGRKPRDGQADRIAELEADKVRLEQELAKARLRGGCAGKTARALGDTLREHRHRSEVDAVTDAAVAELAPVVGSRAACAAVGVPQASWYRRHRQSPAPSRTAPSATPRSGDAPPRRPWPATPHRSPTRHPPDATAHWPVTAPASVDSPDNDPAAAAADRPHEHDAPAPSPTGRAQPRNQPQGSPTDHDQGRSRPPRRPALPSSPGALQCTKTALPRRQDKREGTSPTSRHPHPDVAHDRQQHPDEPGSQAPKMISPR